MEVHIIRDSISPRGIRLPTIHARYWRAIHSEVMTHRVFSRNARSSRAVPSVTLLEEDIFVPHFMANKPGMQATEELDPLVLQDFQEEWRHLAEVTRAQVRSWQKRGMHKQWANRPLEWFGWIDVLITSTDWENFWQLRLDKGAQPEVRLLAEKVLEVMHRSYPTQLKPGQWHLPYITKDEEKHFEIADLLKLSTARCARLSYKPFDGQANIEAEFERYRKLVVSRPVHASPAEHQATPDRFFDRDRGLPRWEHPELHGNFYGWKQHRKLIANESVGGRGK